MTVHEPVRRDGSTRLGRYLTLASAATGAAATQVAEASLVTSDPSWSRTLTATATSSFALATTFGPGAGLLNGKLKMSVTYTGPSLFGNRRSAFAYAIATSNVAKMRGAKRFVAGNIISNTTQIPGLSFTRIAASGRPAAGGSFSPEPIGANSLGSWQMTGSTGSVQGFIAFAISDGLGDWYFGYFDVTISKDGSQAGSSFSLTINAWAYNGTAGQSITLPGASAVPGGTALAALAFGAAGLRGRRRSRH